MPKKKSDRKHHGNLIAFQKQMRFLEDGGYDYRVEYSGHKRHIIYLDENLNEESRSTFFGKRAEDRFEGAHIVKEVKKEILEKIASGAKPPKFFPNRKVVVFNKSAIIDTIHQNDGKCVAMDINSCYWNTAHHLGFISDRLYNKYISDSKKWKKGMVASIGALNKKTATVEFREGKIETHYMNIEYGKLRPYYWAVINRVNDVMNDVIKACGDDFLMWLTDCVYVNENSADKARLAIGTYGYDLSEMNATMLKAAPKAIHFKNDKKHLPTYVNYAERLDVGSDFYGG